MSTYLNNFPENFNKFSFRLTTSRIVFTHLNRLSKTKSTGLDNISGKLIRECADIISGRFGGKRGVWKMRSVENAECGK